MLRDAWPLLPAASRAVSVSRTSLGRTRRTRFLPEELSLTRIVTARSAFDAEAVFDRPTT